MNFNEYIRHELAHFLKQGLFEKALLYVQINFIDTGRNCPTATYLLMCRNKILVTTFAIIW